MRAAIFVLFAAVCFGTTGTAQAFLPPETSPLSVGLVRVIIGGGTLALIAIVLHQRNRVTQQPQRPTQKAAQAQPLNTLATIAVGALGVLAYQPAFFLGTATNGVAVGTLVALGSAPIITGLIEWALTRRYPGLRWLLATAVATVGVALLSGITASSALAPNPLGLLGSLGAGLAYATYTLASKRLLDNGWGTTESMAALFGGAGLLALPLLPLTDTSWALTREGSLVSLWLGLITVTAAYLFFANGLAALPAAQVSTLTLAEPVTATGLSLLLLGERLNPSGILGVTLLVFGLVILMTATSTHHKRLTTALETKGTPRWQPANLAARDQQRQSSSPQS